MQTVLGRKFRVLYENDSITPTALYSINSFTSFCLFAWKMLQATSQTFFLSRAISVWRLLSEQQRKKKYCVRSQRRWKEFEGWKYFIVAFLLSWFQGSGWKDKIYYLWWWSDESYRWREKNVRFIIRVLKKKSLKAWRGWDWKSVKDVFNFSQKVFLWIFCEPELFKL